MWAAGWIGAGILLVASSAASADQIVEVASTVLAESCEMDFGNVPEQRVIACRAPDGTLYIPEILSYNEQRFIYVARDRIAVFCHLVEEQLPLLPITLDMPPRRAAVPPMTTANLRCH